MQQMQRAYMVRVRGKPSRGAGGREKSRPALTFLPPSRACARGEDKAMPDGSLDRELARERNRAEVLEQLCRMFTAPAVN